MKALSSRFIAALLLFTLTAMLCFQHVALAGPRADEGDTGEIFTPGRPSRGEVVLETIKPSVANPKGSQPGVGQTIIEFFRDRFNTEFDRATGGRDVNRNNSAGEKVEQNRKEGKSAV